MAVIKTKLRELRNADVRYISLVDRAATRIPFRVLKRDEETMLDLTKIFKSDTKPEVTAVVVRDSADPRVVEGVKQALSASGFKIDSVSKADNTLVYAQVDNQPKDVQLVRLSEDLVLAVKGFDGPSDGSYSEMVTKDGFYSGVNVALGVLQQKLDKSFMDSTDSRKLASEVVTCIDEFKGYTTALVTGLPLSAFKAEVAVLGVTEKVDPSTSAGPHNGNGGVKASSYMEHVNAEKYHKDQADMHKGKDKKKSDTHAGAASAHEQAYMNMDDPDKGNEAREASMAANDMGVAKKEDAPKEDLRTLLSSAPIGHTPGTDWEKMSDVDKITWMKSWMEGNPPAAAPDYSGASKTAPSVSPGGSLEDSQFSQPLLLGLKAEISSYKTDLKTLTDLVQSIAVKVDSTVTEVGKLTTTVGDVAKKQDNQHKALDEAVKKADTLSNKLSSIVAAPPRVEDTPSVITERSTKRAADGDLRTGQFDTAFLPNRGRPVGR